MLYDAGRCDKPCLVVYDIPDNLYEFFFTLSEEVEPQVLQVVIHIYIYIYTNTHTRMGLTILWAENLIFSY